MRCHSRFKGVWQPAELSDLTGQDEFWRFPNPHPSAAITSHRHLTPGLNSGYEIKQQVKSCTWERHFLTDSSRPKLPILQQSWEMWSLSYTPATSTQHFLAAGRGAAASRDAPAAAQSSICCTGGILPTICKQQNNTEKTTVCIKFRIQAAALATLSCCTTKVLKFEHWAFKVLSELLLIKLAVH